jgi:radical SAM protein with 4Fe4S-binding SPASM domain
LLDECIKGNLKYIKILLNGDDYFGKFIRQSFSGLYQPIRCNAGFARISLDTNGKIYACPAAAEVNDLCLGTIDTLNNINQKDFQMLFYEQVDKEEPCASCEVRHSCGGECLVEKRLNNGVNEIMCIYKKHLIYLAA